MQQQGGARTTLYINEEQLMIRKFRQNLMNHPKLSDTLFEQLSAPS